MKIEDQILIGEIALKKGFISEEQLDECLGLQEESQGKLRLGELLIKKGYLQEENLPHLISLQSEKMELETWTGRKRRDSFFGRLAVKKGYCTDTEVNECLRYQAYNRKNGIYFTLGEYMFRKGYMTQEQVQDVLSAQGVTILICSECQSQYNIVQLDPEEKFTCKNCHQILEAPEKLQSLSVIGSFSSAGVSVGVLRPPSPWFLKALIPLGIVMALFLILQIIRFSQKERWISQTFFRGEKVYQQAKFRFEKEQSLWDEWEAVRGEGAQRKKILAGLRKNRKAMTADYQRAWRQYQQVLSVDGNNEKAQSRLADIAYAYTKLSFRTLPDDSWASQNWLSQLAYWDQKKRYKNSAVDLQREIDGSTYLYLDSQPSGADISLLRWDSQRAQWTPFLDDEKTPFTHRACPPGSYWMILKKKGFPPVNYPFLLKKNKMLVARIRLLKHIPKNMVYIPGGKFLSGPPFEEKEVSMAGFFMDIYEVTNGQYRQFIRTLPPETAEKLSPKYRGQNLWKNWTKEDWTLLKNHPALGIGYQGAKGYARWKGKRLPGGLEWEKAARSVDGRLYPWGWEKNANYSCTALSPRLRKRFPFTFPCGDFKRDRSLYGCYDMAGNLSEWVLEKNEKGGFYPASRGANYGDLRWEEIYSFMKGRVFPKDQYRYTGLRCAMDLPQ